MLEFRPVWFDSMGAKSSCVAVRTDINIVIDPGIAIMHKTFPASDIRKREWYKRGKREIEKFLKEADVVIISHYHHDHYLPFSIKLYEGKTIFVKNPNFYINDSQRKRAEKFFSDILNSYGLSMEEFVSDQERFIPVDFNKLIPEALFKKFNGYESRREELIKKGKSWYENRIEKWQQFYRIPELKFGNLEVIFGEGRRFVIGETQIRFTDVLFHGIEFSRLGWIFSTVIEFRGKKFIHSSDMNGPIIEDYASWIIKENPDILVLDGPMTYMLGYTLNFINLNRAINNMLRIIENIKAEVIIYDHHLTRDPKYPERTKEIWERAKKLGKNVITASEYLGETPAVLR